MNLNDLKGAIVAIAIIALVGTAASIALSDFRDTTIDETPGKTVNDEFRTGSTTVITLNHSDNYIIIDVTAVAVNNSNGTHGGVNWESITEGAEWNSSDGIDGSGRVTIAGNLSNNQTRINYSYKPYSAKVNVTLEGLRGEINVTNYLSTTGTILAISVLIGLIILAFMFTRR